MSGMTSFDLPAVMIKAATPFVSIQKESACFADDTSTANGC